MVFNHVKRGKEKPKLNEIGKILKMISLLIHNNIPHNMCFLIEYNGVGFIQLVG